VLLPALLAAWWTWRFAVDLPILDEWSLVDDIIAYSTGDWSWQEILRSHNGHRIAVPRLILVPLAELTAWDTQPPLALSWLTMAAGALIVLRQLRPSAEAGPRWVELAFLLTSATAWFSANQFESWTWSIMIHSFMGVVGALTTAALLAPERPRWTHALAAACTALVASYSHALGLLAWPLGILSLISGPERRRNAPVLAGWIVCSVLCWAIYFVPIPGDANSPRDFYLAENPLGYFYFALTFLGAPVVAWAGSAWPPHDLGLAWVAGLGALLVAGWQLVQGISRPHEAAWRRFAGAALALSVGAALLTALARGASGGPGAFASRYMTWSTPAWIAIFALLASASSGRRALLARLVLGCLACSVAASSAAYLPTFAGRAQALEAARRALIAGGPPSRLAAIQPQLSQIDAGRPRLLAARLSVFRDLTHTPLPPGTTPVGDLRQVVELDPSPTRIAEGSATSITVRIANISAGDWPGVGDDSGSFAVHLGSRWVHNGAVIAEGPRAAFASGLRAGEEALLQLCVIAPGPGSHVLQISAVQEGVAWAHDLGSPGWAQEVTVVPSRAAPVRKLLARVNRRLLGSACG
jgi:hypothetical protein